MYACIAKKYFEINSIKTKRGIRTIKTFLEISLPNNDICQQQNF